MEFTELLATRKSVRSYLDAPITAEQVNAILEAGVRAPNACNFQSWHFYAVCDRSLIQGMHPQIARIPWAMQIPLMIVICIDENVASTLENRFGQRGRYFAWQDAAGAANHMLLRAADLGFGGCWIGPMDADACKAHLSIAEHHTPSVILTIGTPAADLPLRDRKPLPDSVTFVGALPESESDEREEKPFSLACASLPGAIFDDLNLSGARFNNVNLSDAHFSDINLHGARFEDINLECASYGGLTMCESKFGCVELCGAEFDGTDLAVAEFRNCSFEKVKLTSCNIDGMTVDGVNVKEAIEQIK